jgi:sigma-B regulation protein RsbU (phosphoserine phosphatase)
MLFLQGSVSDGRQVKTTAASDARAMLDMAACGLFQTAADGTFLRVNQVFCSWVGLGPDELIGKRRFQDLLTVGARIFHETHWAPLLQLQGSVSEVKLDILHKEGAIVPMVVNARMHEREGTCVIELATYVARDRDKYERELVQTTKRLEVALAAAERLEADAKDRAALAEQMIGIVSHDLKNPLSTVQMGAMILAQEGLNASQQQTLSRMVRAAERADRLIVDLLDFTQARLGKALRVTPVTANLHRIVAETIEELSVAYPERRLVHVSVGTGVCLVDVNRLSQAIGNLVANAVAYGDPTSVVTVSSVVEDSRISISVHNRGMAISPEMQAHIFEPMSRGGRIGTEARSVGLGLFIVNEIVKAHGGLAQVASTAEAGTTFTLTIPNPAAP